MSSLTRSQSPAAGGRNALSQKKSDFRRLRALRLAGSGDTVGDRASRARAAELFHACLRTSPNLLLGKMFGAWDIVNEAVRSVVAGSPADCDRVIGAPGPQLRAKIVARPPVGPWGLPEGNLRIG